MACCNIEPMITVFLLPFHSYSAISPLHSVACYFRNSDSYNFFHLLYGLMDLFLVTTSHGSASAVSTTPSISPSPTSFSPSPTSSMSPSPSESSSVPASSTPEPTPSSSSTYHPHSTPAPPPPTPYPHYVEFKLKNGSTTCFMMKGSIEFAISYKLKGSKKVGGLYSVVFDSIVF